MREMIAVFVVGTVLTLPGVILAAFGVVHWAPTVFPAWFIVASVVACCLIALAFWAESDSRGGW